MRDWLATKIVPEHTNLPQRMFEHKTNYASAHLKEALALDAKDDIQFSDMNTVMYQIETVNSELFLARKEEIFSLSNKLHPGRQHKLTIIQVITHGTTFILSDNPALLQKLASTKLPGNITDQDIFSLHNVVMRKGIIKALKDAE